MEANRKRRGFVKGKLMPIYRAVKPWSNPQHSSYKPSQSPQQGCVVQHDNYVSATAQPKPQKFSYVVPAAADATNMISREKKLSLLTEKLFGASVNVDESVDMKAASYISSVQERFRLERVSGD